MSWRRRGGLLALLLCAQAAFAQTAGDALRRYVNKRASFAITVQQLQDSVGALEALADPHRERELGHGKV